MANKHPRLVALTYSAVAVGFLAIAVVAERGGLLWVLAAGGLTSVLLIGLNAVLTRSSRIKLFFQTVLPWNTRPIRFSVSYLFRIEIGGEYLLIRNEAFGKYQPVGGVYKSLAGAESVFDRLDVTPDTNIRIDQRKERDLRVNVKRSSALEFIAWFESGRHREIGPWREFRQELIESGLVAGAHFEGLMFRWIRQHETQLQWSKHFQCDEIKIADIFEPDLTEKLIGILKSAVANSGGQLVLVSAKQVATGRSAPSTLKEDLAETVAWIL